ncbi:glycoside hydrolase family 6 protein [Lentzea cavernae]|uniref:Glucanase n=1 Tax=Lentzea cavernae TaxID=2020703 RepID=A0ABQ3M447_9PSEU|nr:glycoside hydrolase family 6 protein [Lentzea cavernae]GHH28798.1 glucanase [Lentzea cavernae]
MIRALALALLTVVATAPAAHAASPVGLTDGFYVDPGSNPAVWVRDHPDDGRRDAIEANIATKPIARWFGAWSGDIKTAVSGYVNKTGTKLPVLVAYNIPGRDACGGHSGGGAGTPAAYRTWISSFAAAIGTRPAVVVIEPDSLADFNCMDAARTAERTAMIKYATEQFQAKAPNTWAYLDAGNAQWVPAATMASRLDSAGVRNVRGFAVNVSNYHTTAASTAYGNAVSGALPGYIKPFVIDTSRNGNGHNGEWCNPGGRRLGTPARTGGGAEMLLWVKVPGDSDGRCGKAPGVDAGKFDPQLAFDLVHGY